MSRRKAPEISVHPAPENLMRFLDGELEEHEAASVRRHLKVCAGCSGTLRQFAAMTSRFSSETLAAVMGSGGQGHTKVARFPGEDEGRELRALGGKRPAWSAALGTFTPPRGAAASIALLLVGTMVAHLLLSPRSVSARGLVDTARQRQHEFRQTHPTEVLQRKLRVTKSVAGKAVGTERWASHLTPQATHEELVSAGESAGEIQGALPQAACRMYVPLSLEMLDCLLDAQPASVQVRERESEDGTPRFVIELADLRRDLSAMESRWTIRGTDWHLSTVEYRIAGEERETVYRIEEESADLVPLRVPAVEVTKGGPRPVVPAGVPVISGEGLRSAEAERTGIRLRIYEAIDAFEPVLDEDLQLEEEPGGVTRISGIVPSAGRRAQLQTLLAAQAGARATVLTQNEAIAEALASLGPQPAPNPAQRNELKADAIAADDAIRGEDPLLAAELAARFGSDEEGKALALRFGAAILEETQHLTFRSRWLERLENAFSAGDWQAMEAGERERFLALRARWREALRDRHQALRERVAAILCPAPCPDPGSNDVLLADDAGVSASASVAAAIPTWKAALDEELALLKTMFVDGAFAPAGNAEQAKSRWIGKSQATWRTIESTQEWRPQHRLASAGSALAGQAP